MELSMLLDTEDGSLLILEAIYLINNEMPELPNEWLDQVIAVAETAALYLIVESREGPEPAQVAATDYWGDRAGGTDDPEGYSQAMDLAEMLRGAPHDPGRDRLRRDTCGSAEIDEPASR